MTSRKFADAARSLLRTTLLEAAGALLSERAWAEISMSDVATRAGVSRQTLYNEFGSREEFAQAFALREASAFLSSVGMVLERETDPARALSKAFERFLRDASNSALVRAIVERSPGAEELFALFTTRGEPVIHIATEHLRQLFQKHWRVRADADVSALAELIVRLAISHASLPSGGARPAAQALAELLGPYLREVVEP